LTFAGEGHFHGAGQLDPPAAAFRDGPQCPHHPRHPPSQGKLFSVPNFVFMNRVGLEAIHVLKSLAGLNT
jgi:hypothetical protein